MKHYLGIDLGGTNIKAGVIREDFNIVSKHSIPTNHPRPPEETIADMAAVGKTALKMAGLTEADISYVGIGAPGIHDTNNNRIVFANNLDWIDVDIIPVFKKYWDIPVFLGNDGDVAALAEVRAGVAKNYNNALMLTIGTGVGGGFIFNNQVYHGGDGFGTEPGHLIIVIDGELCTCGTRGCLEAYASVTGLIRDTIRAMKEYPDTVMFEICGGDTSRVDGQTAFAAAKQGDIAGKIVIDNFIKYLAAGIASYIVSLRPQAVILGGGVCNEPTLFDHLYDAVKSRTCVTGSVDIPPILKAKLGSDAGIIGAALLGM